MKYLLNNKAILHSLNRNVLRSFSLSAKILSAKPSYLHRIENEPLKFVTVGQVLRTSAEKYADRQALVSCAENSSITFAEVLDKVLQLLLYYLKNIKK